MKRLVLLVEGGADVRFAESILVPIVESKYESVKVVSYAGLTNEKLNHLLRGLKATGTEYVFIHDFDSSQCIARRKQALIIMLRELEDERILIVREEIESWYLAGVDYAYCLKNAIKWYAITEDVTKERFRQTTPKVFSSHVDFMIELLKAYSVIEARTRNRSFDYLFSRARFGFF